MLSFSISGINVARFIDFSLRAPSIVIRSAIFPRSNLVFQNQSRITIIGDYAGAGLGKELHEINLSLSLSLARNMASSSLLTGLENKVVLITGGSSGIGRYSAVEFAKNGCKVAISGRSESGLAETSALIRESASSATIVQVVADLEKPEECKRVVAETVSKLGQLDVLVNSAGILQRGSIETLTLEEFDKQMNINIRAVFVITQAAVPHLKATKGSIVNISSVTGHRAAPGVLSYNVSKAALDHFTRSVALELAPAGVRCNAVNPGVVVTNCHRNAGLTEEDYAKFLEHSKTTHALGRVANAEEVAKAIVFLSSNELSGFMTGVTLPIDGGRGITCPR